MKLGLEAKLAIGIVVGFGLLTAGYYLYGAKWLKKRSAEQVVFENFDSENIDPRITLDTTGGCKFTIKNGILTMHETGSVADAGTVGILDNLNIAKPVVIKTKVRFSNTISPGWYGQGHFWLAKRVNYPGQLCGYAGFIFTHETPEGNIRLSYRDKLNRDMCWNGAADKWEICTPATVSSTGTPSVYHVMEFYSDGSEWHFVLKDASGKILEKTASVRWAAIDTEGAPFQFMFGEPSLGYYSTDMDVDFIYASYETAESELGSVK